jgi:hypothetical protein
MLPTYTIKDNFVLPRQAYRVTNFFPYTALQEVKKRCHLYWLTNSALVYEPKGRGCGVSANEHTVQLYTEAQINLGDLTPYLKRDSATRFFASGFFHESVSPQPQSISH